MGRGDRAGSVPGMGRGDGAGSVPGMVGTGKEPLEQSAEEVQQPLPHQQHSSLFLGVFSLSYVAFFPSFLCLCFLSFHLCVFFIF